MAEFDEEESVIVAVTGGLGTGKSTVSKILATILDTDLLDTDLLCRLQMQPGAEGYNEFCTVFGKKFIQEDGYVDRTLLRQAVFEDEELRDQLEIILHPIVQRQVVGHGRASSASGEVLVVEVPLLYEVGWQDWFDVCVVVHVPEELIVQRVKARDGLDADQIKQISKTQMPIQKKLDYAHFIVDNSGTFASTMQQVAWLSKKLNKKFKTERK